MTPAAANVECRVPRQLTVADLAAVFQCDTRTIRKAIHKSPPEFTFYEKLGRIYFAPEDVLQAILSSKHHAVRNSDGVITAVDAEKLWGRIERFLRVVAPTNGHESTRMEAKEAA